MQHAIIGYLFWKWFFYVAEEEKISRKNTSVLCIFPNQIMSRQSIYSDRSRMTYHVTQLLWIQWINWMTILVHITSRSWIMESYQLFLILLETLPRLESQQTSTRWRLFSWMVVQILWHYILAETWKADFYYFYTQVSLLIQFWQKRQLFLPSIDGRPCSRPNRNSSEVKKRPQKNDTTFLIHHSLNWQVVYPKHLKCRPNRWLV